MAKKRGKKSDHISRDNTTWLLSNLLAKRNFFVYIAFDVAFLENVW